MIVYRQTHRGSNTWPKSQSDVIYPYQVINEYSPRITCVYHRMRPLVMAKDPRRLPTFFFLYSVHTWVGEQRDKI